MRISARINRHDTNSDRLANYSCAGFSISRNAGVYCRRGALQENQQDAVPTRIIISRLTPTGGIGPIQLMAIANAQGTQSNNNNK